MKKASATLKANLRVLTYLGTGHTRVSPAQRVSPPMTITLNRVPYIGKGGTTPYVFGVPF